MKKKYKTKIIFSFIIVFIIVSLILLNGFVLRKNRKEPINCLGPEMAIFPFNKNNITVNNGGWKIAILSGCKITKKWSDLTIEIFNNQGIIVMKTVGISQYTAYYYYNYNAQSNNSQLLVYQTGEIFVNYNNVRTPIGQINPNLINEKEIESFENVSFSLFKIKTGSNDVIDSSDYLFIYRDFNGDGIDEIPINSTVQLFSNGADFVTSPPLVVD